MSFLISTDGPKDEWWAIPNRMTQEFIDACLSGNELVVGVHDYVRSCGYVNGICMDLIEPAELRPGVIDAMRHGANIIIDREDTNPEFQDHYRQLLSLLAKLETRGAI